MRNFLTLIVMIFIITNSSYCDFELLAWWNFDDGTAKDQTGHGYDGLLVNNPKFISGYDGNGYAVEFQGYGINTYNGSHILLPWIDFTQYEEFTIMFWGKISSFSHEAGEAFFFYGDHEEGWLGIMVHVAQPDYYGPLYIQFSVGSNLNYFNQVKPISILFDHSLFNKWVHYQLTYKNGTLFAYIDGKLVGTKGQNIHLTSHKGAMASHFWDGNVSTRMNGAIDDVRIYVGSCDETAFSYPDFSSTNNLNFVGQAFQLQNSIVLTQSKQWINGAVWLDHKVPVKLGFSSDFSFKFADGVNKYEPETYEGADGIAFVIQNDNAKALGALGGGIGFSGIENSFAVEFDTYKNYQNNLMQSNLNDPSENHIGIFCNGTYPNEPIHGGNADLFTLNLMDILPIKSNGQIYYGKIEYDYESKNLSIYLDTLDKLLTPLLVIPNIDLSRLLDLDAEEFAWVGFTSSTGIVYEQHQLLSWNFCPTPTDAILIGKKDFNKDDKEIKIYPNPADNFIIIESDEIINSIVIYDLIGNVCRNFNLRDFNNYSKIDISTFGNLFDKN